MRTTLFLLTTLLVACSSTGDSTADATGEAWGDAQGTDAAPTTTRADTGAPVTGPIVCTPGGVSCDDDEVWGCNETGTERILLEVCDNWWTCENGACKCIPDCASKACGDDSCGGSCGSCGEIGTCAEDFTCCDRLCGDKECGPDACGGVCGTCGADVCLSEMGMCCTPDCAGKTCGNDGCGGTCGECEAGVPCPLGGQCGCEPICEDVTCDVDGCGGLCGDCFTFEQDDGSTETAYGYTEAPTSQTTAVACLVRIQLPHTAMRLTSFTAGWMYGLWDLQLPFELVVAPADTFTCQLGDEDDWWAEACTASETSLVTLASLLPARPYEPQPAEDLGDHVMPAAAIFIGARFLVTDYPVYVCPIDSDGTGTDSFMFPVTLEDGVSTLNASALKTHDNDIGALALRFAFELTDESLPVASAEAAPPSLPEFP